MPDKTAWRYLYVGIDRVTRWVFVRIDPDMEIASVVDVRQRPTRGRSHEHRQAADGQRCVFHRPLPAPRARTQRPALFRRPLPRALQRAPAVSTLSSADQRPSRTIQRPDF